MTAGITLGGPDPFPEETAGDCSEMARPHPELVSVGLALGYVCTRDAGHAPPHVAVAADADGPAMVVAVWPPYQQFDL